MDVVLVSSTQEEPCQLPKFIPRLDVEGTSAGSGSRVLAGEEENDRVPSRQLAAPLAGESLSKHAHAGRTSASPSAAERLRRGPRRRRPRRTRILPMER